MWCKFKVIVGCRTAGAKLLGLILLFSLGILGCSQTYDPKQVEQAIGRFESGSIADALALARGVAHANNNAGSFLAYQFSLYAAMQGGDSKTAVAGATSWSPETRQVSSVDLHGAMIAAKVFGLYSAGDAAGAMNALSASCREWGNKDAAGCVSAMLAEALGRYYAAHEKLGALYLYESAYVFAQVVPNKALGGKFYRGVALMEINQGDADRIFKDMIAKGEFNAVMAQQYCGFARGGRYKHVLNCDEVPEQ